MNNIIKLIITTVLLTGFSSASIAAWADSSNTSEVRLVATIDNGPALRPVEWTIFRVGNPSNPLFTENRHSFTLHSMKPGRYTAVVNKDGEIRRRDFYVMADTTSRVRIPID
uniref:Uncharacterized protein n=1 Tax=uncultured Thiotrichaceae bacterium TaxID=298394 RepID=A0A6S6UK26_9GAMM|nr:MAG: Unknown protein [uncultured Thiotrichaceae bacterium]